MKDNKKIKICIASIYAFDLFCPRNDSAGRVGGAEMQLYNLAIKLAEDPRFEVHFFVGNFGGKNKELIKNVIVYKIFDISKVKVAFNFINLWFILKKINFDICIQRSAGIETGLMALFCKINNKKFVYMIANDQDISLNRPKYLGDSFFQKIRWILFKMGLKRSELVFCQNIYQKENLLKNYNKESILRNNAHFLTNFTDNIIAKKDILWVGRADRGFKQPELFLELAKKLENYNFVMICQSSSDLDYFNEIKRNVVDIKNLKFIEHVPFKEIEEYYKKALILVNTSISEGFPNTFIEAFKNGAIVFSLNVNPNNILSNDMGFCFEGDLNIMTESIEHFMKNKENLLSVSRKAFEYVKDNHDIKKIIDEDKKNLLEILK